MERLSQLLRRPGARIALVAAEGVGKTAVLTALNRALNSGGTASMLRRGDEVPHGALQGVEVLCIDSGPPDSDVVESDVAEWDVGERCLPADMSVIVASHRPLASLGYHDIPLAAFPSAIPERGDSEASLFFKNAVRTRAPEFRFEGADDAIVQELVSALDGHPKALELLAKLVAREGTAAGLSALRRQDGDSEHERFLRAATQRVRALLPCKGATLDAMTALGAFNREEFTAFFEEGREAGLAHAAFTQLQALSLIHVAPNERCRVAKWLRPAEASGPSRSRLADRVGARLLSEFASVEDDLETSFELASARLLDKEHLFRFVASNGADAAITVRCASLLARTAAFVGLSGADELLARALERRGASLGQSEQVEALADLADAYRRAGHHDKAEVVLASILEHRDFPRARAVALLIGAHLQAGTAPARSAEMLEELAIRFSTSLSGRERARAQVLFGYVLWSLGRVERASVELEKAICLSSTGPFLRSHLDALDVAVFAECLRGNISLARKHYEEEARLVAFASMTGFSAQAAVTGGYLLARERKLGAAQGALISAADLGRRAGLPQKEADALAYGCVVALARGDVGAAREFSTRMSQLASRSLFWNAEFVLSALIAADIVAGEAPIGATDLNRWGSPLAKLVVATSQVVAASKLTEGTQSSDAGILETAFLYLDRGDTDCGVVELSFRSLVRSITAPLLKRLGFTWSVARQPPAMIKVAKDESWFEVTNGTRIDLTRRATLRQLFRTLVLAREHTPGVEVSKKELVVAGWPGEAIRKRSATNRLHVALSTLRRFGLEDAIWHGATGYLVREDVQIVRDA